MKTNKPNHKKGFVAAVLLGLLVLLVVTSMAGINLTRDIADITLNNSLNNTTKTPEQIADDLAAVSRNNIALPIWILIALIIFLILR